MVEHFLKCLYHSIHSTWGKPQAVRYLPVYVCDGVSMHYMLQGPSTEVVPLQVDASGKVKYDVLARVGQGKDKVCTICLYC